MLFDLIMEMDTVSFSCPSILIMTHFYRFLYGKGCKFSS